MKDITHIQRANLPWRDERVTECGLDASRHPTWSRAEVQAKQKKLGKQRLAMLTCMTCLSTYERHTSWEEDPASCMLRHAQGNTRRWVRNPSPEQRAFSDELRAIAMLVEAHREEFDSILADLRDVVDLSQARRQAR